MEPPSPQESSENNNAVVKPVLTFRESISTFWWESNTYIAVYAAFALLACIIVSAFEFHNQTSTVPYTRLLLKAIALMGATVVIFTLWLYVTGWQSRLLGGEIITSLALGALWYAALYFLNASLLNAIAVSLQNARLFAHLPVVLLILPCFAFYAFIVALGSAWKN